MAKLSRVHRSAEGPRLPGWLLEELYMAFQDTLSLLWNPRDKNWFLCHKNPTTGTHWPFATWEHKEMDRRLIDTLHQWDTRKGVGERLALLDQMDEDRQASLRRSSWEKLNHDPVIGAFRKFTNDVVGYPKVAKSFPGMSLVHKPTAAQAMAFGTGIGRSTETVKTALGG